MTKETKSYKIGKKNQHKSGVVIRRLTLPGSADDFKQEHFDREDREHRNKEPKNNREALERIITHCHEIMSIKAKEMGLTGDEDIRLTTAYKYSPVFVSGLYSDRDLKLALHHYEQEQYKSAFERLLNAIPNIINTQELYNESTVMAGASRQEPGSEANAERKEKQKAIAKPIFESFMQRVNSKRRAAELTLAKLKDHPEFSENLPSVRTMRGWF